MSKKDTTYQKLSVEEEGYSDIEQENHLKSSKRSSIKKKAEKSGSKHHLSPYPSVHTKDVNDDPLLRHHNLLEVEAVEGTELIEKDDNSVYNVDDDEYDKEKILARKYEKLQHEFIIDDEDEEYSSEIEEESSEEADEEDLDKPSGLSKSLRNISGNEMLALEIEGFKENKASLTQSQHLPIKISFLDKPASIKTSFVIKEQKNIKTEKKQKKMKFDKITENETNFKFYDFGKQKKQGKSKEKTMKTTYIKPQNEGLLTRISDFCKGCCKRNAKPKIAENATEIEKQFKNRVIIRYCCVVLIPLLLLALFFSLFLFTRIEDRINTHITELTDLNINMSKCVLSINDEKPVENTISTSFYVTLSIGAIFNKSLTQSSAIINYYPNSHELNISILSVKDSMKSCQLSLNIPLNLINNLRIHCLERCYVLQKSYITRVNYLEMTSKDRIFVNFLRLEVNSFYMKVAKGSLQLNSFKIKETAEIDIEVGDITLQSDNDLEVHWQNSQQTFCFTSPLSGIIEHSSIFNCYLSDQIETKSYEFSMDCEGNTRFCLDKICSSPLPIIITTQQRGNLYINRLKDPFIDIAYNDYQVVAGAIYDQGISFEPSFFQLLEEMKKLADDKQTDQIFTIEIGRKYLQSQSNSFWTIISNPSFAYMRPWWLATFSLSLLTANSYSIQAYLSPGLCPYHIEPNIEDIYVIQNYLDGFFALNTSIISYIDESYAIDLSYVYNNGTGSMSSKRIGL